ncbi:MAG: hypothetical protein MJ250_03040 [Alphaproteobacteria bacterium]|nr:hypothetical protein [Alphaproteobacteria bacterium]
MEKENNEIVELKDDDMSTITAGSRHQKTFAVTVYKFRDVANKEKTRPTTDADEKPEEPKMV